MKVSVNWLKQFTDIDISIDELVAKIGAQLGAVEEVIDLGKKYQGIIVAKVVSCEKHPNADKLSVCWIDDGGKAQNVERNEHGHVQVVCGAPNVRAGLTVAWLPPGSTVPSSYDRAPFVLEARELRGVVSNGMLASLAELAIGDDHSGIVELDLEADPGTDFAELYELNDFIIDIENKMFTHRPDCFGILGIAREVAGIQQKAFKSPDWYRQPLDRIKPGKTVLPLSVKNDITDLVPRFMAVAIADVTIKPSPLIIQTYLSRVGLRPINNIVDVTNYLMFLTGQPTHAYDYDKLTNGSLETRKSRNGDKLRLLNGKEIEFSDDSALLITSNDVPVGIGGVMGGADTEVTETTKNIVIECANFDMYDIRRTSMKHGLFTDAVTRFNKGQSPLQNDVVLEETVATIEFVSGGHVASAVIDVRKPELPFTQAVEVETEFINTRLGSTLATRDIAQLLENVECQVETHGERLKITAGYWRTDIELPEDVVEEVGRLYGYDNLPVNLPTRSIRAVEPEAMLSLKSHIRHTLAEAGSNEVLTYSFVHGDLLQKVGQLKEDAFMLSNALSPGLQYYRLSLLPSLLEKVHPNIKSGFERFSLFEMNKTHAKQWIKDGLPKEHENLALIITADNKLGLAGAAYYQARHYLDFLADSLGLTLTYTPLEDASHPGAAPFEPTRSAKVSITGTNTVLGVVGEFKNSLKSSMKLPAYTAGFEIALRPENMSPKTQYKKLSKYPSIEQDISLRVPADMPYAEVAIFMNQNISVPDETMYELLPLDLYVKKDVKHITFRLKIASYVKTMTAQEVNTLLDELASKARGTLGAERI